MCGRCGRIAFYPAWHSGELTITAKGSRIEGIGCPRVDPSPPGEIDHMLSMSDTATVAAQQIDSTPWRAVIATFIETEQWEGADILGMA